MSVMSGTFPYTYGVFYMTVNCQCVRGPSCHRHGERHRRNALPKRLTRRRDGDIRAYSRQGMRLYFVGPYPFNLTRRTRRRYPTRRMGRSRVYQEHRRVLVGNPTTRNPLLTLKTVAVVEFVGLYKKV
jgi:hypothetical protein